MVGNSGSVVESDFYTKLKKLEIQEGLKSQEKRYNLDLGSFCVNRFWGRRPDGAAINEALKIVYILEFKRSTDRDEGLLEVKDAEAH